MRNLLQIILYLVFTGTTSTVSAVEMLEYLTDADGKYNGPSVEDNVKKMDTDQNGFADVFEVRAFLELKHGKGYQKALLDKWEVLANSKSCGTSFVDELMQ